MNKPKIRFKGFEGEWKERKFGDFGHVEMCKRIFKYQTSSQGEIPFYKIGTFGFQPDAFISRSLYEDYRKKFSYPKKGDILISAAGTIGRTIEYKGEECYYQDSNIVWLNHNEEIDNAYLKQLYSLVTWSSLEGATIKRLYNSNILNTHFNLPSLPEQRALASYFTSLDAQISASTSRLSSLKQIKAASLLNMFPQKGETVPRVRFKGFQGEWKERKLGEVCLVNRGVRITRKDLSNAEGYPVFQNTNYPLGFYQYYNVEAKNPFVIIGGSAGLIGFSSKEFWAADDCVYFKDKEETDKSFLYNILCSHEAEIKKEVRGSSVPRLDRSILEKLRINLPSLPEQRAIASYFTALDAQITLQRERLEKLKQIKAACLEKMFA